MLRQIIALTLKDLKVLFKDTGGIAVFFLMPAMFIFVMSNALAGSFSSGNGQAIHVLAVNQDRGSIGAALVADLKSGGGINFETEWDGAALTRASAEQLIVARTREIAIVIPADFSEAIGNGSRATIDLIVDPATSDQVLGPLKGALAGISQQAVMHSQLPRGIDALFNAIDQNGGSLPAALRQQLTQAASQSFSSANSIEIKQTQPAGMTIEQFPNTVQQNVPGWTLFGVFFIAQALAISILEEKRSGAFRRLMAAPMSRATILLGKLAPHMILNLIQIALMFAVGVFILPLTGLPQLNLGAHPEGLILISVCASLAANGLGLLLAALGKTAEQIGGLSSLLVVTLAAIGGVMVPRFVMPQFMQTLSFISPHAWALTAYQDILVRGYGVAEILPECAVLLGFAAVFFGIALWRFKWA
jgi:ABC-2 type transport system permease protein